jgi:hypothetical protein
LLDINFEQNLLDLLISYKSRMGICFYDGPRMDIIAKESMLDLGVYQEFKLDTKLVTSLWQGYAPNLVEVFTQHLGSSTSTLSSSSKPYSRWMCALPREDTCWATLESS